MGKHYKIGVLPGDGIGPEVIGAALKVLDAVQEKHNFDLELHYADAGANCIPRYNTNLPKTTLAVLENTDACLKAPTSCNQGEISVTELLRKKFELHATAYSFQSFPAISRKNINLLLIRERTEGLLSLERKTGTKAVASRIITKKASEKIAKTALEFCLERKNKLTVLHKSDLLPLTDGLFKETVISTAKKFKKVKVTSSYVDQFATEIIQTPENFDVVVTENMYGSILAGEVAGLIGGRALTPVSHLGEKYAIFETMHGSAPNYTNKNVVNPLGMILSANMMLSFLGEHEAAESISKAIKNVFLEGRFKTYDLGGQSSTSQVAEAVSSALVHNGKRL